MIEERVEQLERELAQLKQRNSKVESDKAWETSPFRVYSICAITYLVAVGLLFAIDADRPVLGAVVPVIGFLLSMQSLPAIKRWWVKRTFDE